MTAYHSLSHLQTELTRGDGPQFLHRTSKSPPKLPSFRGCRALEPLDNESDTRWNRCKPWAVGETPGLLPLGDYVMTTDLALSAIGALLLIAAFVSVPLDDGIEPVLARFR